MLQLTGVRASPCRRPRCRSRTFKCRVLRLERVQTETLTEHGSVTYVLDKVQEIDRLANLAELQLRELLSCVQQSSLKAEKVSVPKIVAHKRLEFDRPVEDVVFVKTTREERVQRDSKRSKKKMPEADDFAELISSPFTRDKDTRLLTADEEKSLAEKIQRMMKIKDLRMAFKDVHTRFPTWTELSKMMEADEVELQHAFREGNEAKETMVSRNMRLVMSIASRIRPPDRALDDVIADGSAGLIRAIEKFDPEKGYKLSTYAHWWIRQAIGRGAAEAGRIIKVPSNVAEIFQKMIRSRKRYLEEHGVAPTDDELARRLNLPLKRLLTIKNAYKVSLSLEAPLSSGSDADTRGDLMEDRKSLTPEEAYAKRTMVQDLELVISTLPEKEALVLRLRYGLDDGHERTLEEIGHLFHVTRERVRQIETRALRKLRQRSATLKEYLEPVQKALPRTASSSSLKS